MVRASLVWSSCTQALIRNLRYGTTQESGKNCGNQSVLTQRCSCMKSDF